MSKEKEIYELNAKNQLMEVINELIRIKLLYYKTLKTEEVIIDNIVYDVYLDLRNYMENEMDTYLPNITEYELLNMIVGGMC